MKILLILFVIISIVSFLILKNKEQFQKYKKFIIVGFIICFLILLFTLFHNSEIKKINFEKYLNTDLKNTKQVNEILSALDIEPYKDKIFVQTSNEPYSLTVSLTEDMSIVCIYQKLEKNALILFSLISNVDKIVFERNGVSYSYYFEDLNSLFSGNLRSISISSIEQRYENEIFNGNGIYMGSINGYLIVDESVTCEEKKEFLKTEENINYYLKCSDITSIYLYKDKEKYSFQEKMEEFSMESLSRTNLNIIKENVSDN